MKVHTDVSGLQQWGQRALSIITYENAALRDEAKKVRDALSLCLCLSRVAAHTKRARAVAR